MSLLLYNGLFLGVCGMVLVSRFIDEIAAILLENDVSEQSHLRTLKFEYLAWPEKVSGALWLSLHSVCQSMHLSCRHEEGVHL